MAQQTKRWTLRELHRLPDDGNKYELVHGALFVTPPPSDEHEEIRAILHRALDPYVARYGLGRVYRPRAVIRRGGSEVEMADRELLWCFGSRSYCIDATSWTSSSKSSVETSHNTGASRRATCASSCRNRASMLRT